MERKLTKTIISIPNQGSKFIHWTDPLAFKVKCLLKWSKLSLRKTLELIIQKHILVN